MKCFRKTPELTWIASCASVDERRLNGFKKNYRQARAQSFARRHNFSVRPHHTRCGTVSNRIAAEHKVVPPAARTSDMYWKPSLLDILRLLPTFL